MSRHAFFIADDRVMHIANPCGAGIQYHAQPELLVGEAPAPARRHETAETVIVVKSGAIELMVNGAVGPVAAGSFARVPANTWYAYRNIGEAAARLLVRTAPAVPVRDACRITIRIAAA